MTGTTRTAPDIFSIPAGISFADQLAGYVLQQTAGDPLKLSSYLILLPSRRSCRTVREAFLRLSYGRPMVLPRLQPLGDVDAEELAITLSGEDDSALDIPPAISPLRRQVVLARTIMKLYEQILPSQQRPRFDQATLLADELAALLDQVQTENLAFEQLDQLVPEEFSEHWQITLDFLKILTENWPAILDSYGAIDPAARRNRLLAAQAQLWRDQPPQTPVIAAGSIASIPATIELLDVIAGLPQGQIILPGLDTVLEDDAWQLIGPDHPQYFLKKLLDALEVTRTDVRLLTGNSEKLQAPRQQLWSEALRPAATTHRWQRLHDAPLPAEAVDGLSRLSCKTPQDEAETIAIILREVLETPDKTAAVVTPDRALARRVSAALKRWGVEADDSAGTDLHQTPKGNWALITAEMVVDDFAPVALLTALRHPMTRLGQGEHYLNAQINRLEILGLRGPRPENGLQGLRRRIENAKIRIETERTDLYALLDGLTERTEILTGTKDSQPFAVHLKNHIEMLEKLAETAHTSGAERIWQGEDGEALSQFFAELFQLADDLPALDLEHYLLIIRQLMSRKTVRPKYGTHPRISILGQIEARLYVADLVIIAGLNEGVWPPETRTDPWMSRQMRQKFGLPAQEQVVGIAAHDFAQLASAPEVILTRSQRSGGAPTVPSRWLLRLETVLDAAGLSLSTQNTHKYEHWKDQIDHPAAICPRPRPAPTPPVESRPRRLSVTGIERLMRDPYEVYVRYILSLWALDPLDADPAASERGQLLHKILEKFVSRFPDKLPLDAVDHLLTLGRNEFDALGIPADIESFWWPRFERLAQSYIDEERHWRQAATPLKTEGKGRLELDIEGIPFALTAIADRIDRFNADDSLAVIDYKTGAKPNEFDIRHGYAPQLWLEALIAARGGFPDVSASEIAYLGFWIISGGASGKMQNPIDCSDAAASLVETSDGLRRVLGCFFKAETPYIARPNPDVVPRYSDYLHLERVQEWIFDEDTAPHDKEPAT